MTALITDDASASESCPSLGGMENGMPAKLGDVRLIRQIGEGGMGRVFLGHHPILDIDVAVKVLHDRYGDRTRFLSEARLAARIQHDNIVRIHNAGDESGYRYLVMEYVAGRTLKRVIQENGPMPWREATHYALQAARGLAAAHRQGIIHRDVKPSNLLLDGTGRIKVADLGLARAMQDDGHSTLTGNVVGTPTYMAPEQAEDARSVTPAADVYGLGICLFYLIAGEAPYVCRSFEEVAQLPDIPDVRVKVPAVPTNLALLLGRMVDKDPAARPADGSALVSELERVLGLATVTTTHQARPASRTRPWFAAAAGLTVLTCIALLGWGRPGHALSGAAQPPSPLPAPVLAVVQPADSWQTPPRSVFVIAEHLPVAAAAALDEACTSANLTVVERQRIDHLLREQDLAIGGRLDPATIGRLGHLIGGHIAIFAQTVEDRVEVRTVLVESGELVSSRFVPAGEAGKAATDGIRRALVLAPVQARVGGAPGAPTLSAGSRHGVTAGDRIELRHAPDGQSFATATVTAVEHDRSTLRIDGPADPIGAFASRIAP